MSKLTYYMMWHHLGGVTAERLSRTVWKDGIDINVVDAGLQALVDDCTASITAERDTLAARVKALESDLVEARGKHEPLTNEQLAVGLLPG